MPKYTNSTNSDIAIGSYRIGAKESITIQEYLQNIPAGITEDDSVGYYDPIILSRKDTSTATFSVPTTSSSYEIKFFCSAGDGTIKFNNASATVRYIGTGETIRIKCMVRIIDSIILTISSGTIYTTIEKI